MPATARTEPASSEDFARLAEPLRAGLLAVFGLPPAFSGAAVPAAP